MAATQTPPVAPPTIEPRRWTIGRILVTAVVVGLVAMWSYVLYLAFGPGRQPPIDRLDDPTFARAAEERCAEALAVIDELPSAQASPNAGARSQTVTTANLELRAMLDDLADIVPSGEDGKYVREWLADWELFLGDRERYAAAVREDPEAPFLVSEKPGEGRQVEGWVDEFAKANVMPSCETPTDV